MWYRFRADLSVLRPAHSIYLVRLPVHDAAVFVNGDLVWALSNQYSTGVTVSARVIPIPARSLRAGENLIHVRIRGYPSWFHGMPRLHVGDSRELSQRASVRNMLQGQMIYSGAAVLGTIGLLALLLWIRNRRDAVLFWYGITGAGLLAATVLGYLTNWREDLTGWRSALSFLRFSGYLTPLLVLHLRLAGRRHPWLEGALWLGLAAACVTSATPSAWQAAAWTGWGLFFAVLPLLFIVLLLRSRELARDPAVWLLVAADIAAAGFNLHDWAVRFGLLDFDRPLLYIYVPLFIMLAAGAPILKRLFAGVDAMQHMNVQLEERVAEKAREIEANHAKVSAAERAQALAEERKRIMADMHDGLGSRLVGLLSLVQSGRVETRELGEGISAALDELRLAIDSLEPVEGDVGVVLGNVRHRMRSVFERAGVHFHWNVEELPRLDDLTPSRILAIQRILLEVFTNAIKHSAARTVSVSAERAPGEVRIMIEDDGRGFDTGTGTPGHGLSNLQLRAVQAGGTLRIESAAGSGTRVRLALPLASGNGDADAPGPTKHSHGVSDLPDSGYLPDSGDIAPPAPRLA